MKTALWIISSIIVIAVLVLALRPLPSPVENECLTASGTVTEIYEGGVKDVVFKLKEHDRIFYINRGLENGFELGKLRSELVNKVITIKYPKHWTPLDPFNSVMHISKLELGDRVIYSEVD